jgi:hypothetical protein
VVVGVVVELVDKNSSLCLCWLLLAFVCVVVELVDKPVCWHLINYYLKYSTSKYVLLCLRMKNIVKDSWQRLTNAGNWFKMDSNLEVLTLFF